MKQYKVLISSTLGIAGTIVELPDNTQTKQRLAKGIVCEVKIVAPVETKTPSRKSKK